MVEETDLQKGQVIGQSHVNRERKAGKAKIRNEVYCELEVGG